MTAADGQDLTSREETLRQSASLTWELMQKPMVAKDSALGRGLSGPVAYSMTWYSAGFLPEATSM